MSPRFNPDDIIDIHVHFGAPFGENEAMYFWSKKFAESTTFDAIKLAVRMSSTQMSAFRYLQVIFDQIKQSKHVNKVVLLAMDKYYSEEGYPVKEKTNLYVDNNYLMHLSHMYDEFLFGCSVHPYAPDAIQRLWHCANSGAVLCKWLPSAQGIDPTHPLSVRFYRALADLNLPLLLHVGPEEAIPTSLTPDEEKLFNAGAGNYGKTPGDAISSALDSGASVIVAHCATPLGQHLDKNNDYWETVFNSLLERIQRTDLSLPLYADLSALCLPGRFKYIKEIIPLANELPGKFLYGSDYPIPVISMSEDNFVENLLKTIGWLARRALPANDFDLNYSLLSSVFPGECFTSAQKVLRNPEAPLPDYKKFIRRHKSDSKNLFSISGLIRRIYS